MIIYYSIYLQIQINGQKHNMKVPCKLVVTNKKWKQKTVTMQFLDVVLRLHP